MGKVRKKMVRETNLILIKIKDKIPKALREQVWINFVGKRFYSKCYVPWCKNEMNVFDFHVGHNLPESKGGKTILENLRPICARCNLSMSNNYTIDEWASLGGYRDNFLKRFLNFFVKNN